MPRETDAIHHVLNLLANNVEPTPQDGVAALRQGVEILSLFFNDVASIADSLSTIAWNSGK